MPRVLSTRAASFSKQKSLLNRKTETQKPMSSNSKKPAEPKEPLTRVKVVGNFRVVYDGMAYSNGDIPEVPPALAEEWLKAGWVTEVPE